MELVEEPLPFGALFGCQGGNIEKKQQERFLGSLRSVPFDPEQVVKTGFVKIGMVAFLPGEVGTCL
jgi:hypothetical protein